jgi:hypothetical protein
MASDGWGVIGEPRIGILMVAVTSALGTVPEFATEDLKEITKYLSQDIRYPGRNSNRAFPEHKPEAFGHFCFCVKCMLCGDVMQLCDADTQRETSLFK